MNSFKPWKILHISVNEKLTLLPIYPDYQGLYIVFWWQNIPLGYRQILAEQLPISATELLNIAIQTITPAVNAYLTQQGVDILQPQIINNTLAVAATKHYSQLAINDAVASKNFVSIVIPTRNRTQQLSKCLDSLQNLSQVPHEIIVVDNAPSSDSTEKLVNQIPNVRYILEPQAGASKARNTGIIHATGDIVAFIDDDMTAHPDWLIQLQQSFNEPDVMAVTGLVLPGELTTKAQLFFEEHWSFNRGFYQINFDQDFFAQHKSYGVPVWWMGGSGNMAVRRQVFDFLGGFDERLGAGKNAAGCSEDSEFCYRLLAEGLLCRYEPKAVAYHYHRAEMWEMKRQVYSYMRGHVAALLIQFEKYRHWGNLRRLFVSLPKWYLWLFFEGKNQTWLMEVLGCVAGVVFYFTQRQGSALGGFADLKQLPRGGAEGER